MKKITLTQRNQDIADMRTVSDRIDELLVQESWSRDDHREVLDLTDRITWGYL